MSTLKQKELAKNIVKNATRAKKLNKTQLVVSSGYSPISAESSAHILIAQVGVEEELKTLGFTEENAKKVVQEILLDETIEPSNRLKAASEVFKVFGTYSAEKSVNLSLNADDLKEVINNDLIKFRSQT